MPVVARHLKPGHIVAGRYEVRGQLGAGGMGTVYRVHDRSLSEDVALKVLRLDLASDPRSLERFRQEIRLARKISHPNVCRVFDLDTADSIVFLTMELVNGETLRSRIAKAVDPLHERLRLFEQIARGLAAVHSQGIIHRDIKPENVLVRADGAAVVVDFGLAVLSDEASSPGRSGLLAGTPLYMSPEQLRGEALDTRSDVFALGLLGYELLTGKRPFGGGPQAVATTAILRDSPEPPVVPGLDSGLARSLTELLLLALAKDKAERWPSATALADAIAEVGAQVEVYRVRVDKACRSDAGQSPERATTRASGVVPTRRSWVTMRPSVRIAVLAVLVSGLLDQAAVPLPDLQAPNARPPGISEAPDTTGSLSTRGNGGSRTTNALPSNVWRAENFVNDFDWQGEVPLPLRGQGRLTLLGARRLSRYYNRATAMAVDGHGFVYVAGIFAGAPQLEVAGRVDAYIARLSASGTPLWIRPYTNPHDSDRINSMIIGADGHLYAAGEFAGSVDFGGEELIGRGPPITTDAYVVSYTESGEYRWIRHFGDSGNDRAAALAVDRYGHVTVVGRLGGTQQLEFPDPRKAANVPPTMYTESLDQDGGSRWSRWLDVPGRTVCATASYETGNLYLVGTDEYTSRVDGVIASFGRRGEYRWSRRTGTDPDRSIHGVALDSDENIYMVGRFHRSLDLDGQTSRGVGRSDAFVASLTSLGKERWSYRISAAGYDREVAMAVSDTGDVIVTATVAGTVALGETTFDSGTAPSTIMALFAPSGALRDVVLL
jgi:serine/threonine-protein kinase